MRFLGHWRFLRSRRALPAADRRGPRGQASTSPIRCATARWPVSCRSVEDWESRARLGPRGRPRRHHPVRECRRACAAHLQDELRRDGFHVIGGSAYGDRLENDRGLRAGGAARARASDRAACGTFDGAAAKRSRFVAAHPGRYVLKFNGPVYSSDNYVGQLEDGARRRARSSPGCRARRDRRASS